MQFNAELEEQVVARPERRKAEALLRGENSDGRSCDGCRNNLTVT